MTRKPFFLTIVFISISPSDWSGWLLQPLIMIRSILIPLTQSQNQQKALHYGALLATRMQVPLQLLQIVNPQWIPAIAPIGASGIASGIEPF